jgi:dTDP-4-dehydrorhamnose 3,5-epimerase
VPERYYTTSTAFLEALAEAGVQYACPRPRAHSQGTAFPSTGGLATVMEPLGVEGAWAYTPRVHADERGSFLETFRGEEFAASLGYRLGVAQVNCSVSRRGVIRGIHYADVPPGQAKYVSCVSGAIIDVVVDLRTGSPGFGKWEAVRLDDQGRRSVFLAEGLGHGFMALSEQATVLYLCSTPYAPGREHGVDPLDPGLGIGWPLEEAAGEPVLSAKDAAAPSLEEALRDGLLPRYEDCLAYLGGLRSR